ncbi:MAG: SGNH/GDSL hydrolase family protein [Microcoleaceae cyanobacterium]
MLQKLDKIISLKIPVQKKSLLLKQGLRIAGQTALITAITFALTEITFRIYHRLNPSFMFYDTSYNRWRGKPHAEDYTFQLNSSGFKDLEFSTKKDKNTLRIVSLGDSFSYGVVPYEYNYLTVLEDNLNQFNQLDNSPKKINKIEVYNMGIIGTGPKDYLSLLVNEGLSYKPDLITVGFYLGNDFIDNRITAKERKVLKNNDSYVVTFLQGLIKIHGNFKGHIHFKKDSQYADQEATFADGTYLEMLREKSMIFIKNPVDPSFFQQAFHDALSDLIKIKEVANYQKIPLVVIIIPDEIQVNQRWQQAVINDYNVESNTFDFQLPNKLLAEALTKNNIDYVDLTDDFKETQVKMPLYKLNDTHWNIAGNKLAADIITEYLSKKFFNSP